LLLESGDARESSSAFDAPVLAIAREVVGLAIIKFHVEMTNTDVRGVLGVLPVC
jgi:hypothetical protein